jgi:WD40 repeat protein
MVNSAINATKWDRMFSQPFVYALDGHSDSIPCLATVPTSLTPLISGASDGEIKVWHLGMMIML